MKTVTPTALRQDLFECVGEALRGRTVRVTARQGSALLISEKLFRRQTRRSALRPRIEGRIVGDLDGADEALRAHVKWPRQ